MIEADKVIHVSHGANVVLSAQQKEQITVFFGSRDNPNRFVKLNHGNLVVASVLYNQADPKDKMVVISARIVREGSGYRVFNTRSRMDEQLVSHVEQPDKEGTFYATLEALGEAIPTTLKTLHQGVEAMNEALEQEPKAFKERNAVKELILKDANHYLPKQIAR